jgi:hypothetical protein
MHTVNGIERGNAADKKAVTSGTAEANIGDLFRYMNFADEKTIGGSVLLQATVSPEACETAYEAAWQGSLLLARPHTR